MLTGLCTMQAFVGKFSKICKVRLMAG